jgi:plastocyanin
MNKTCSITLLAALLLMLHSAAAADITGTVTLKGTPPKEKEIAPLKQDATCGKMHAEMPTTHFYVVGPKGELADVVVYLKGVSAKSTGESAPAVTLDQKGCEYTPQIFAVQTGQKIVVKNSDPVLHNVHSVPSATSGNSEQNTAQMPGSPDLTCTLAKPEMFMKFKCDVHPWMFAWVSVFDNPYFAVTDKEGHFKIANVPPGKYTLEAAHRKAGTTSQEIEVKEGAATQVDLALEVK